MIETEDKKEGTEGVGKRDRKIFIEKEGLGYYNLNHWFLLVDAC